jgi:hypothetical protein
MLILNGMMSAGCAITEQFLDNKGVSRAADWSLAHS